MSILFCKFCIKSCKNENSHRNHERLCKLNPARDFSLFHDISFQKHKNGKKGNQFTKAANLGLPKPEITEETREKLRIACKKRSSELTKAIGKKISKTINKKVADETWHTSLAKHMHIDYKGIDLHGSWEHKYVLYLEENNIPWIRNKEQFDYFYKNKKRKYTPDFYLPNSNEYIEIKGYKTEKDDAKWKYFPNDKKLVVLMQKELKEMNII